MSSNGQELKRIAIDDVRQVVELTGDTVIEICRRELAELALSASEVVIGEGAI